MFLGVLYWRAFVAKIIIILTFLGGMSIVTSDLNKGAKERQTVSKCFISYRHVKPDEDLAQVLEKSLSQQGHKVFVDTQLLVGMKWAAEIEKQIKASDTFIVLLSADSIRSDMVRQEVELAYTLSQERGEKFVILPIRVDFKGELPFDLGAYLNAFQYERWTPGQPFEKVAAQVLKAVENREMFDRFNIPEYDRELQNATSKILKVPASQYKTEGVVRRFLKGSIYQITKKGDTPLKYPDYNVGNSFRVEISNIGMKYEAMKGPKSQLGFPISEVTDAWKYNLRDWETTGFVQWFEGGNIYFTEGLGARILLAGKIRDKFIEYEVEIENEVKTGKKKNPMTGGVIGFPMTDQYESKSRFNSKANIQRFELGYIVDWEFGTYGIKQGFYDIYQSIGECDSELGFPKSDETSIISAISQNKGAIQFFENGCMIWNYKSDKGYFIYGEIFRKWEQSKDKLGFPQNNSYTIDIYTVQNFEGGRIKLNNNNGAIIIEPNNES